ncbi:hypothetical protein B0T13DRAFT_406004 [Neurospora crassa]|nr:hypothetical protein B0T13DRAFT_406004 [Neurospora crassa]
MLARREKKIVALQESRKKKKKNPYPMVGPKRRKRDNREKGSDVIADSDVQPETEPEPEPEPESQPQLQPSTGLTLDQLPYDVVYMIISELWASLPPHVYENASSSGTHSPSLYPIWGSTKRACDRYIFRQLLKLPLVSRSFYYPAQAHILKYTPLVVHRDPWLGSHCLSFWGKKSNRPILDRIQRLRIDINMKALGRYCTDDAKPSEWEERSQKLLEEMERLGQNLTRPIAGLPALKGLDVRIQTWPHWPISPNLLDILDQFMTDLQAAFECGHFVGLRSLRLIVGANYLAPILRSVLASKTCSMLRSFSCCQLPEFSRPQPLRRRAVYIHGPLIVHGPGSEDLIVDAVSSCPQLRNLSIPSRALFHKNLRLHPENKGLDRLFVVGNMDTIHEAEKIASIKKLTPKRGIELERADTEQQYFLVESIARSLGREVKKIDERGIVLGAPY